MKLSVIVPSYNEGPTIGTVIRKVLSIRLSLACEIIVVDDGSSDNSWQILAQFTPRKNFKLITNKKNLGKGASIIKALSIATGDIILIQDADLEYNPADYPKLLAPFKNRQAKVVYGSRVLGGNPVSHWTFNLGGRLVTFITNLLLGTNLTDEPTGYKVFRREVLKKLNLKSKRFEFCPEVTTKIARAGIKIIEVPISYTPRPVSEKKIKWWDGVAAIFYLLKFRFSD